MLTFIIPAHNAGSTLDRTLRSVREQTRRDWEAVVVDDGSLDDTAEICARHAAADTRIRIVEQPRAGVSGARNAGLQHARGDQVTFLDADDTVARTFFARMASRLAARPDADGVCCGSERRNSQGRVISRDRPAGRTIDAAACGRGVPVPIHALLIDRRRVQEVGGFDATLRSYEDWDFWIRLTAAGVTLAVEPAVLAIYWSQPASLTRDGTAMIRSHRAVLTRAQRITSEQDDEFDRRQAEAELAAVTWSAGVAIGGGRPFDHLVDEAPRLHAPPSDVDGLASSLLDAVALGVDRPAQDVLALWPQLGDRLSAFLDRLAVVVDAPGLDYCLLKALEKEVVRRAPLPHRQALTRTLAVPVTLGVLRRGVEAAQGCDSVLFKLGRLRRLVEAPLFDGLSGQDVGRLLLRQSFGQLLRRAPTGRLQALRPLAELDRRLRPLARALKRQLRRDASTSRTSMGAAPDVVSKHSGRADRIMADARAAARSELRPLVRASEQAPPEPGDEETRVSSQAWDAFFSRPDPWNYESAYEQLKYDRTFELVPDRPIARALEVGCAEGRFTERLAPRVESLLAVDISPVALSRAAQRCARFDNVTYRDQEVFEGDLGSGWDLIAGSEILYYMRDHAQLVRFAARVAEALAVGGVFLHAHAHLLVDDRDATGFDWPAPFGGDEIARVFEATPGLRRVRTLRTELYRIDLFERTAPDAAPVRVLEEAAPLATPLEPSVARAVVWNGAEATRAEVASRRAYRIPVLMYHRVAAAGPPDLTRFRVHPADFERQLLFLRRRGFRPIGLDEWRSARLGGSVEGRPVMITFDDAYVDFAHTAWPALKASGFSAHVFVPTDKVGGAADWDGGHGEPAPLMDWQAIAELASEGVTFGSHLASHPWADRTASEPLLREAARSKAALERVLDREVTSVAPPFGATNARVEEVLRLAGYRESFLIEGGPAPVWRLGLSTPRIEVRGDRGLEAFAASLEMEVEPASARDEPPDSAFPDVMRSRSSPAREGRLA